MNNTLYSFMETPLGPLMLIGRDGRLEALNFQNSTHPRSPEADWRRDEGPFREATRQLGEYFSGERKTFDLEAMPINPIGTPFQSKVWQALRGIPYGSTINYGQLAQRIGKPTAARAVGAANGRNPIPVIIPCHRVIGSNGHLTGFYGGLHLKQGLLTLECDRTAWDGPQAKLL